MFALYFLTIPEIAARTAPVAAVVNELLDILTDTQINDDDALNALRQAIRWLRVFAGTASPKSNRDEAGPAISRYDPTGKELFDAPASRKFAATWLRGNVATAARAEPIIAIVQELRDALYFQETQRAQAQLRQAVRLLEVFVADEPGLQRQ